jgi:hypothetical protein
MATQQDPGDAPIAAGGAGTAMSQLFIWPASRGEWVACPPDEITWLDRGLVSGNRDLTLHRAPRCAGLRYVHHRWELFSRDPTHQVYLAPHPGGTPGHQTVRMTARHVLPVAPAQHYETLPVVLAGGTWLVGVGTWVVALRLVIQQGGGGQPAPASKDEQPPTQEAKVRDNGRAAGHGSPPRPDAVPHVRAYFERNRTARLAMAYHYQEFILGLPAPQPVPMMDVVIALDLSGEGAISDYKKLLQGFIWAERGHPRQLAQFLLANGLLTHDDLAAARQLALDNERSGRSEMARQRLQYRPKPKRN